MVTAEAGAPSKKAPPKINDNFRMASSLAS
jgi:hypothetical protein